MSAAQKMKDELTKDHLSTMRLIDFADSSIGIEHVGHVSELGIHMKHSDYSTMISMLHDLRPLAGGYKLGGYYAYGDNLCVNYDLGNGMRIIFYCADVEFALQQVSKGKCRLECGTKQVTENEVVCDID